MLLHGCPFMATRRCRQRVVHGVCTERCVAVPYDARSLHACPASMFTMTEVTVEPDAFDCVVLGTGLPESLIAGCVRTRGAQPNRSPRQPAAPSTC